VTERWGLVWAHYDDLIRVARRRTPCAADAEDCVSEAMLRTVLHPGLDLDRVGAFLTAVTVRVCADLYRDRSRSARIAAVRSGDDRLVPTPEALVCDRAEAVWLAGLLARALSPAEHAAVRDRAAGVALGGVGGGAAGGAAGAAALARARAKARPAVRAAARAAQR
jgi:DNA-directed RNA polymerase specialized sigma24 family protein